MEKICTEGKNDDVLNVNGRATTERVWKDEAQNILQQQQ